MTRQTVDFGIDLGTTNSAIACMEKRGPRIVRNRYQSDLTPSAVAITSENEILVGQDAIRSPRLNPALKFKRLMGTNQRISMGNGVEMSPIDLSAEVLKELKASVRRRYDEDLVDVVITVPAMFQQPQCEATYEAARRAGLNAVALLQEPIAAATAYLSEKVEEGYYLVYDLGGGTFDVSLIHVHSGEMHVIGYGGDNFLGGSDFDLRIAQWLINQLQSQYGPLPHLQEPAMRWRLMRECEDAKIRLTDERETFIDLSELNLPIKKIPINRDIFSDLIEDLITKTINHTNNRIQEANLKKEDISGILLVGGPTQTPYIRERIREELQIPIYLEDPMTIVALGAAIYAGTILKPNKDRAAFVSRKTVSIELYYEPVCPDVTVPISGRVSNLESFEGEVRFVRSSKDWETGWIKLKNRSFVTNLKLNADEMITTFNIELRDTLGNLVSVNPSLVSIRFGTAPAKPVTPYHYGVALDGGTMDVIIESGSPLPAYGYPKTYRTNKTIHAGTEEEFVIYFLEGHSKVAEDNLKVGELRLKGIDFPHSLRQDEKVEIRMRMDESRRLSAKVYIPVFDREFDVTLRSVISGVSIAELERQILRTLKMVDEVDEFIQDDSERQILVQTSNELERLKSELIDLEFSNLEQPQTKSVEEFLQRLLRARQNFRPIYDRYRIEVEQSGLREMIEKTMELCEKFDDKTGIMKLQNLQKEADKCRRLNDLKGMNIIKEQVAAIFHKHAQKTNEFWLALLQWLENKEHSALNQSAYKQALSKLAASINRGDIEEIREAARLAISLLPEEERTSSPYENTIIKL